MLVVHSASLMQTLDLIYEDKKLHSTRYVKVVSTTYNSDLVVQLTAYGETPFVVSAVYDSFHLKAIAIWRGLAAT